MATFADLFSAQNLDKVMSDPRLMLGLNLLQAAGPQAQQMSGGQRLAQAAGGFIDQRAAMQQAQQLQAYRKMQMEAMQAATQQRQAEAQRDAELRHRMQDPAFASQLGPFARLLAQSGADTQDVLSAQNSGNAQAYRAAQLGISQERLALAQARANQAGGAQGPKAPAMRQTIDKPLPNNMYQRQIYDPQRNAYVDFGAPFSRSQAKADPLADLLGGIPTGQGEDTAGIAAAGVEAVPTSGAGIGAAQPMAAQGGGAGAGSAQAPVSAADANAPATPKTQAEYDALPVGALYVDPKTGGVFTKKAKARS